MRVLSYAFFALSLAAQVPLQAPPPQPQWLIDLQGVRQATQPPSQQAELGSLDGKVERAWQAALQEPQHPEFQMAVQMASSYYESQGYGLKAEQVLRQALAAAPAADLPTRRNLRLQLAGHFESAQQLVKALAIREELANEPPPAGNSYTPPSNEASTLANLYERMGEFEKAEAAWKKVVALKAAEGPREGSGVGLGVGLFVFGYRSGGQNELASFYARHGRPAEAEKVYSDALAEADRSSSADEWSAVADGYIDFLAQQRRFDDAVELSRRSIARLEGSSDPQAARMLLGRRQRLASLLTQAGRNEEALAVQTQAVQAEEARGSGNSQYPQALAALAETLIQQNRLEEAEKAVAAMRAAGAGDAQGARFHESMAVQMLARIRDLQNKPEEARKLRESVGVPDVTGAGGGRTVGSVVGPAQQAAIQGNVDVAVRTADEALALAAEHVRTNPREISSLMSLASMLVSTQQEGAARRIAVEALAMLERAPDHPRVAEALGSVISTMARLGMGAETGRAMERQEKILLSAKGAGSLSLNSIGEERIALLQHDSDSAGVIEERKRILARTENATGPKSRESLFALREVAWAYTPVNNWPDEERVLATLRERTARFFGESSVDYAHILEHSANRAGQNRDFDEALAWMDQAIEIAQALPNAGIQVKGMMQERERIVQMKEAPPGGPFYGPSRTGGRWFDTNGAQGTDGSGPVRAVISDHPFVVRQATPNATVAQPVPAPPPEQPNP